MPASEPVARAASPAAAGTGATPTRGSPEDAGLKPCRHERGSCLGLERGHLLAAFVHEVAVAGGAQQLRRQGRRLTQVFGERERLLDEIARMTPTQREVTRLVVVLEQVFDQRAVERDILRPAVVSENHDVIVVRRALAEHLVMDAAKERLV